MGTGSKVRIVTLPKGVIGFANVGDVGFIMRVLGSDRYWVESAARTKDGARAWFGEFQADDLEVVP